MKKEVYINWANSILKEIGKKIEGIPDIQAGHILCDLINILSPNCGILNNLEDVGNVDPATYIQTALDHMKKNGIKSNFTSQDIIDGDIKSILDCLWQIILNYSVHDIEHNIFRRTVGIGKRNLLEWCQKQLKTFFDGKNTLANNLCAGNWFTLLLEKFIEIQKEEDQCSYVSNLLKNIENKYGIVKEIIIPSDIIHGTADEHALMIYITLLRRKTDGNKLNTSEIDHHYTEKSESIIYTSTKDSSIPKTEKYIMSENETELRDTVSENIIGFIKDDRIDGPYIHDSQKSHYLKEEEKPIILKRPTDYYNDWENNIDRLSQGPVTTTNIVETRSTPEDLLLNIDDFNDSFDKSRSQVEHLYKPDYSYEDKRSVSDNQRRESRSPSRIVNRYQNNNRYEYRHSPDVKKSEKQSSINMDRKSRSSVKFHGRRDDRSPSPEAFSHFDDLQQARKDVDKNMQHSNVVDKLRSKSDERGYKSTNDQISERTKALRLRASASLERENRIRKTNQEMQAYNNNITEEMVRKNLGLSESSSFLPDPVNVISPFRHIGSAERIYKDEDSTFIKLSDAQIHPPHPYELGSSRIPRREEWERKYEYNQDLPYTNLDLGHQRFLGSLDREIDQIDTSIDALEKSRRQPRFSPSRTVNDKLWSQEFRDISNITNPYHSLYNIHDDNTHLMFETRSRSLSPHRSTVHTCERPKSSLGICQPNYKSDFKYEDVGLAEGKYPDVPLGRFDVRTNYYNPDYGKSEVEATSIDIDSRPASVSPSRQRIHNLGYSSPVRRINDEIWGSDLEEIEGLDPQRQEKWKHLINLTDMTNEDVIELKQALASAIVENDILFAKLTNAKKEFSEKLLKTNEVLDDCRKHLATAQAENQELRTFLNQEKRINAALEARINELKEQLSVMLTDNKEIEIKLHETVSELETVRVHIVSLQNYQTENDKLNMKVSTLERDNQALRDDLGRMQDTHEKSQRTTHEIRKCLEEVRNERHDLQDEVSKLRFKEKYGPYVDSSVIKLKDKSFVDSDVSQYFTKSAASPQQPVRSFKPIIQSPPSTTLHTPQSHEPNRPPTYTSLKERESPVSSHQAPLNLKSSLLDNDRRLHLTSTLPSHGTTQESKSPEQDFRSPRQNYRSTIHDSKSTQDYRSELPTTIPLNHTSKLASPSFREHSTISPLRPRSESLDDLSQLRSDIDITYDNYKPGTISSSLRRSTSPLRYSDASPLVPSAYREIYPHRKSRIQERNGFLNSRIQDRNGFPNSRIKKSGGYESKQSNNYIDYPDLQQYPTRLRYSNNDDSTNKTRQYSSYNNISNGEAYPDVTNRRLKESSSKSNDMYDEQIEYEYVKKVTTITDRHVNSQYETSPEPERLSRKDTSFTPYRSSFRSRSQSPLLEKNMSDEDFNRELDSVFDSHQSFRARSMSPARFPRRGILKHATSEQNLGYQPGNTIPISTKTRTDTPPTRVSPSAAGNTKTVYITPTDTSSVKGCNDVVRTTVYDKNKRIVSERISPNTRYQIEIDGDLSVMVNGNLNVITNDMIGSVPPPLSDEQRYYANQLIDKYTKPSCALRTVNI